VNTSKETEKLQLDTLYRTYAPMVLRRCRTLLKNEEEALDVMQDVFFRILARKEDLELGTPSSLLWNTATRLCLNVIRDKKRHGTTDSSEDLLSSIANLDDESEIHEHRSLLSHLFRHEPKSSQLIAVLHLVDGMTLEETAREVGMSVSGVRKRLKSLRTSLTAMEAL
jgi:RNA polymerase sigma-70 factor (ECF subfamily)